MVWRDVWIKLKIYYVDVKCPKRGIEEWMKERFRNRDVAFVDRGKRRKEKKR